MILIIENVVQKEPHIIKIKESTKLDTIELDAFDFSKKIV